MSISKIVVRICIIVSLVALLSIIIIGCSTRCYNGMNPDDSYEQEHGGYPSLGTGPDISDNLKPPTGGLTEDYLDDLEDFLDDTYDDVEGYEPPSPESKCTCSTCTCSDPCVGLNGGTYTGSYNGYFKDKAGNYYFITKAAAHSASSMIQGFDYILYVYYI